MGGVGGQLRGQGVGGGLRLLRRGALDHGDQEVAELREGAGLGDLALAPGESGVEQGIRVRGDAEAGGGGPGT
jgi:hypothetical protein